MAEFVVPVESFGKTKRFDLDRSYKDKRAPEEESYIRIRVPGISYSEGQQFVQPILSKGNRVICKREYFIDLKELSKCELIVIPNKDDFLALVKKRKPSFWKRLFLRRRK